MKKLKFHKFDKDSKPKQVINAYYKQAYMYDHDVAIVKKYHDNKYTVAVHHSILKKGSHLEHRGKGTVNLEKLMCNIRRAQKLIREYGECNDWTYFVTLTLDKRLMNRYDLNAYIKKLGQYIRNLNRGREVPVTYMLIPEKHKDGAYHMHGFINGLRTDEVSRANVPGRKRDVYNWIGYSERFGFSDLELIEDRDKAVSYITKYVSKSVELTVTEVNAKTFYHSNGLKKAEVIKRGHATANYMPSQRFYKNDIECYSVMTTDSEEVARSCVYDSKCIDEWQYERIYESIDNPFLENVATSQLEE